MQPLHNAHRILQRWNRVVGPQACRRRILLIFRDILTSVLFVLAALSVARLLPF